MFSFGCVFYYVLSDGAHPYGESFCRQGNIISGDYNLEKLNYVESKYFSCWKFLPRVAQKRRNGAQMNIVVVYFNYFG